MSRITSAGVSNTSFANNSYRASQTPSRQNTAETNSSAGQMSYQGRTLYNNGNVTRLGLERQAAQRTAAPRMDAVSERRLAQVNPELAERIRRTAADLRAQGINVMVNSGFRSFAEQNNLYAQGRTAPGNIVTKARGGQSLHNYGLAVDLVPVGANGQPNWNASESVWQKMGAAGKRQGLEWGGDWRSFKDRPHFQMTGGRSTSNLLAQYNRNGGNLQDIWRDVNRNYPSVSNGTSPAAPNTPNSPTAPTNSPDTNAAGSTARLSRGSRGEEVRQLQKELVKLGFMTQAQMDTGPGVFGPRTDAALRAFQRAKGLEADGVFGPRSQTAMGTGGTTRPDNTTPTNPTAPNTPTDPTAPTAPTGNVPASHGAVDTQLPARGTGFVTYGRERNGGDQYATARTVGLIRNIAAEWNRTHPNQPIQIGDLSRRGGGRFAPHSSHQTGRDADIRPFRRDGAQVPTRWQDAGYDRNATRDFIRAVRAQNPNAVILFNDPVLVREGLTRPYRGHDNHLHVSFR